jgi:5-methylthioadenosine/S-adenosylhomocysteine deaminase
MQAILKNVIAIVNDFPGAKGIDLRIDGTVIGAISEEGLTARAGEAVIEGHGKLVTPGFINAHTHLPMVLFRGLADDLPLQTWLQDHIWPIEKLLGPEDVYWASLLALAEMIRAGTTQFADMYFFTDEIGRAVEEAGLRALLSYGIIALTLDRQGQRELEKAESVVTRWKGVGGERIQTAVSPHSVYTCGEDVWRGAIALAQKHEVPLHTHLAETQEEVDQCRAKQGLSPVFALEKNGAFEVPTLAAHCVHVDQEDIRLLAERGVKVVHCPKSNAKLGTGIAPIVAMRQAGITVMLGTDGAASNNSLNMIEEMRAAALLQKATSKDAKALTARDVFEMATVAGREILGTGGLAVGQEADLVLIDLDHVRTLPLYDPLSTLVYAAHAESVSDVIVAGQFVLRERELVTIDEERVKEEVKHLSSRYRN